MRITPDPVGALVDLTTESHQLLDQVALAYAADPTRIGALLMGLATAREEYDLLIEEPGVDRPVDVIENAEIDLKGARAALLKRLNRLSAEPVTVRVAETDCRRLAAAFDAAANQSVTGRAAARRAARLAYLPLQQDRGHAA